VYYGSASGMTANKLSTVLNELKSLPEIERVGIGSSLPTESASGNNIRLPDEGKDLFNVADMYWIDDEYLSILNIPVTEGTGFSRENTITNDFIISRKGAELLSINTGWNDGVIGKQIHLTEHGTNTIKGVFPDFVIESFTAPDLRPAMFSYMSDDKFEKLIEQNPNYSFYILVKAHDGTPVDIMKKISDVLNIALPHRDAVVKNLEIEKQELYSSMEGFRTAMFAGNIVILLITFLGLLGYTANEASRRSKELAIRRISGARLTEILNVFLKELDFIALPAVLAGLAAGFIVAQKWMENFALKTTLPLWVFLVCGLCVLVFISLVTALNYIIIANRNPVEAIRHE
jgi:putative ABC transport system permease protein